MKDKLKNIILLQGVVAIYTVSGIMSKKASEYGSENFIKFLFFFGMEFVVLGIYAFFWQQIIKRFELSVAYANRSMAILWSMIWAVVFFHDKITLKNIIGVLLVLIGTVIINTAPDSEEALNGEPQRGKTDD